MALVVLAHITATVANTANVCTVCDVAPPSAVVAATVGALVGGVVVCVGEETATVNPDGTVRLWLAKFVDNELAN